MKEAVSTWGPGVRGVNSILSNGAVVLVVTTVVVFSGMLGATSQRARQSNVDFSTGASVSTSTSLLDSTVHLLGVTATTPPRSSTSMSDLTGGAAQVPLDTGWIGYEGNRAIYPTLYQTPVYIGSAGNSSFAYQTKSNSSGSLDVANSILVSLATSGPNASWYAYQPGGVGAGWSLHMFISGVGASSEYTESQGNYWYIDYEDLTQQVVNLPSSTHMDLLTSYDTGVNVTQGNAGGGSKEYLLTGAMGLALDVASIVFPPAGFALDPLSILLDLIGTAGGNNCGSVMTNTGSLGGNETVNQWVSVNANTDPWVPAWQGFGQSAYVDTTIPLNSTGHLPAIVGSGGAIVQIGAQDQIGLQPTDNCGFPNQDAATASDYYYLYPAISVAGSVQLYPGGPSATDVNLTLQQSCSGNLTDFLIPANLTTGSWHFFADPWCTYQVSATGPIPHGSGNLTSPIYPISTNFVSPSLEGNASVFPPIFLEGGGYADFAETGLASGTQWTVNLGPLLLRSTGSSIAFHVLNGTYVFSVAAYDYAASPATGTVTIKGNTVKKTITFTEYPSAREDGVMTYDAADGYVVMFGGSSNGWPNLADTWTFAGGKWTLLSNSSGPPARINAAMTYDAADGYVLLFGGCGWNGGANCVTLGDTWTFKAGQWSKLTPSTSPSPRYDAMMTYDPGLGAVLLYGGVTPGSGTDYDTWEFAAGKWTEIYPSGGPGPLAGAAMVYDTKDKYVLIYGGVDPPNEYDLSWKFTGNWTQLSPNLTPYGDLYCGATYDSAKSYVVLFAGCITELYVNQTWTFVGGQWTNATSTVAPAPRNYEMVTYDAKDGYVLLFGGGGSNGICLDDTWKYVGGTWTELDS